MARCSWNQPVHLSNYFTSNDWSYMDWGVQTSMKIEWSMLQIEQGKNWNLALILILQWRWLHQIVHLLITKEPLERVEGKGVWWKD